MTANAYHIKMKDKFCQKKIKIIYAVKMTEIDKKCYRIAAMDLTWQRVIYQKHLVCGRNKQNKKRIKSM